ncbi:hypothetical protein N0B51_01245 [Tsuneonella sp. YG55]|uniref:Uncharacterized protein n=1 Tax=Tsuneonella litorea TaxID=2976475 RepID=A0A9X3AKB1_9SPHN|nr:hypothetical protein [Tsuneonella litorea]MCT2557598.1 hypothetical protein [Tsuneonella litorea]
MTPRARTGRSRAACALLVALGAAPMLSGCIAAAALPVLAAGGVAKSRAEGSVRGPAVDRPVAPASQVAAARVAIPGEPDPAPPAGPAAVDTPAYRLTTLTQLPPPSGVRPATGGTVDGRGWDAFAAYARRQASIPVIGSERRSAMLADPSAMKPETRICSVQPASVLIDLDPGETAVDLNAAIPADPALAGRLAALREAEVIIGWVSSRTADQAGMVRRALKASGLDPQGRDELVLLRFPEERKQTRRDDFAKSHCVVAIAGDQKTDFDELFAYLRNPALALPLERLIGAGWFIAPPPLATN